MNKLFEFFFHRHTFNPDKWVEIERYGYHKVTRCGTTDDAVCGHEYVYTNTCLTCGTLQTKIVNTL